MIKNFVDSCLKIENFVKKYNICVDEDINDHKFISCKYRKIHYNFEFLKPIYYVDGELLRVNIFLHFHARRKYFLLNMIRTNNNSNFRYIFGFQKYKAYNRDWNILCGAGRKDYIHNKNELISRLSQVSNSDFIEFICYPEWIQLLNELEWELI